MRRVIIGLILMAFMVAIAVGDVVHLKDGRKFEGRVTVVGDKVKVLTKFGPVTFPRSSVARIEKKDIPADVYAEKAKALADDDAEGHYKLGLWCKTKKLSRQALIEFEKVITIDPEHKGARGELGFVKIGHKWQKKLPKRQKNIPLPKFTYLRKWKPDKAAKGFGADILLKQDLSESEMVDFVRRLAKGHDPVNILIYTSRAAWEDEEGTSPASYTGYILFYVKNKTGKGAYRGFNEIRWMQEKGKFSRKFGTKTKL